MTRAEVDAWADTMELSLYLADGFDDAILGVGQRFAEYFVVYDTAKVIQTLVARDGMSVDDAIEWYEFNIVGGYHSRNNENVTPCFVTTELA